MTNKVEIHLGDELLQKIKWASKDANQSIDLFISSVLSSHFDAIYNASVDEVNKKISAWNAATRSTIGPRPGETRDQYEARLIEARKKDWRKNNG